MSSTDPFKSEKSNGKRSASEFDDDDDFGPESNVDAVDDILSPTSKKYDDNIFQDKDFEGHYNPFMEHQEKAALETEKLLQRKEEEKEREESENNHDEVEEDDEFDEIAKDFKGANEKDELQSEFQQHLENTQRMAREETPTPPADTGRLNFLISSIYKSDIICTYVCPVIFKKPPYLDDIFYSLKNINEKKV